MRSELASLNRCAVPFLSRVGVNFSWYDSRYITCSEHSGTQIQEQNDKEGGREIAAYIQVMAIRKMGTKMRGRERESEKRGERKGEQ